MPVELSFDRFDGTGDGPQLVVQTLTLAMFQRPV